MVATTLSSSFNVDQVILPECITIWILDSILIIGFVIVYKRVVAGSQITLIKRICIYLIIANIGSIIWCILYYKFRDHTLDTGISKAQVITVLTFASICLAAQDFFFFIAHWVFAIQYFAMSRNFPLLQANKDTSQNDARFQKIRRYFIIFILISTILSEILYAISNY